MLGYTLFNLRTDPFELTNLIDNPRLTKRLPSDIRQFVDNPDSMTSKILSEQTGLGYSYPVTGAKYTFWKMIFTFLSQKRVLQFMRESGRLGNDKFGDLVGTSYCTNDEYDRKFLKELLQRQKERNHRYIYLSNLLEKQFGNIS